jgi:hypothetical protein
MRRRARLARAGDRRSSLALTKKVLLSLVVVGLLGSVTYKRVDATLSGNTTNLASSATTGTLVVGDSVYTQSGGIYTPGTQCKRWTAATKNNYNASCDVLALDPPTGLRFPGQIVKAYVAIQNAGSLPATQLQLSMPACQTVDTTGTPAYVDASTGGTGEYCTSNGGGGLEMYVQEVSSSFALTSGKNCVFPENYYGTPAADCSTNWLQDSGSDLSGISCWDLGPETANTTRYFVIAFRIDPVAANTLQGKTARFTLRWHLYGGSLTYDTSGVPTGSSCANYPVGGIGQ